MLYQVDGVYSTPCPVSSCPAYEPNSGSFFPKPINKCLIASRGADIVIQSSEILHRTGACNPLHTSPMKNINLH